MYNDGIAIRVIERTLPMTIKEAQNLIKQMKINGELQPRRLREKTKNKVKILHEQGKNKYQIAQDLNLNIQTVEKTLRELFPNRGRPKHNYINNRQCNTKTLAIQAELQKGELGYSEIARKYNVSRQYVFRLSKEQKLKELKNERKILTQSKIL